MENHTSLQLFFVLLSMFSSSISCLCSSKMLVPLVQCPMGTIVAPAWAQRTLRSYEHTHPIPDYMLLFLFLAAQLVPCHRPALPVLQMLIDNKL